MPGGSADSTPTGTHVQKFGNAESADFVLNGSVIETKLSLYGKVRYFWPSYINKCQSDQPNLIEHMMCFLFWYCSWTERVKMLKRC